MSAEAAGVAVAPLLAAAGITDGQLATPEALVGLGNALALWREAAERSGDDALGLHAGERANPQHFGALGYVLMSSATIGDALRAALRYERLMYMGFTTTMRTEGDAVVLRHAPVADGIPVERQPMEFALATMLTVCRRLGDEPVRVREVRLRHAAPRDTREHERIFGVRPVFAAAEDALVFAASAMERPVRGASEEVLRTIAPVVERLHLQAVDDAPTTAAVRVAVTPLLTRGVPTIDAVARGMAVSTRSLQRKLLDEGTTFQRVTDDTRKAMALAYLRDPTLTIGEAGFLTGFGDVTTFHKAVKRWTGETPGQVRRQVQQLGA